MGIDVRAQGSSPEQGKPHGWTGGGAQCTAMSKQAGRRCRKAAQPGVHVCNMHGAGSIRRARERAAKLPDCGPLKNGTRTTESTLARMLETWGLSADNPFRAEAVAGSRW